MRVPTRCLVVAAGLMLAACQRGNGGGGGAAGSPQGSPPPPQVAVVTVTPRTIPVEYVYVGQTEASRSVEIRARVAGFLLQRTFEEGKPIKEGDLLFRIDPAPYQADLEIAQARLAQAQASSQLADAELERLQQAAASGAANRHDLDESQTQAVNARAAVNLAKADLDKAQLNLSYCQIKSPVTGIIGRAMKDEGSYLDAGPNSLLAVAVQTDPMYVTFPISERDWLQWREDVDKGVIVGPRDHPPVRIVLLDGTVYGRPGVLTFFDPTVNPQTGAATARADLPNPPTPESPEGFLKPGQFVHVHLVGWERPNSLVVPQRAVMLNPTGASVLVVGADHTTELRPVRLGEWKGDGWLVLGGLKPGEVVIADGTAKVQPGSAVTTAPYTPPAEGAAGTTGATGATAAARGMQAATGSTGAERGGKAPSTAGDSTDQK
jgi:membrane fusion protein (multidrug efflux system)